MNINYLMILLKKINSYEVMNELLYIFVNLFNAINEVEIYEFIDTDITGCLVDLLKNINDPILLNKLLVIINLLLIKGDPNIYLENCYKYSDNKITNVYQYQFQTNGLYDILIHLSITNKHNTVSEIAKKIITQFFTFDNKILTD